MPIKEHHDSKGYFIQWGTHGAKYYFNPDSQRSHATAYKKAHKQMAAAYYSGYKGKGTR